MSIKLHWLARQIMSKPWNVLPMYGELPSVDIALMFKAHADLLGLHYPYENALDFFNSQCIEVPKVFNLCVCLRCKNKLFSTRPVESCILRTCPGCDLIGLDRLEDRRAQVLDRQYTDLNHFLFGFSEQERIELQQILELYYGD